MKNIKLLVMIEAAFFAAFAFILDLLPSIKLSPAISISFAMVPIFILAFRRGVAAAVLSGFLWGLLQVMLGDATILTPTQFLIEYFIAFAFVGFAGLLYPVIQKNVQNGNKKVALAWIVTATLVGSTARYFWHFLAGVIFWGEYAPKGMSPIVYSFIANGATMLGAFVFCSVVLGVLLASAPRLIQPDEFTAKRKAS
ncbi:MULTISPECIES: energy-coupled thiamine transporter ThiT [Clostridia]|uniref:energy-coupled thiamine transporter ThiT n=1 Tax=Clostridia TaxID=186801 RepID=UPI000EA37C56|nr:MULTISPECIES: energy-coupled thiamine transporter ThiT [Clostridia]NBJ71323.1 energy-coupled thiamine transporter ThiT [Roseburia sp. 1XD42-34]RKI74730.1 energy-coupled thiamine transporter ThiT [Clostridium sp. 1xD42-85]